MSGVKRVTVDASRHQQLLEAETRLRSVRNDIPMLLADVREQAAADLQRRMGPIEQRQQEISRNLGQLTSDVREYERRTTQRVEEHHRRVRQQIAGVEHNLQQSLRSAREEARRDTAAAENRLWEGLAATSNQLIDMIGHESAARAEQMQEMHAMLDEEAEARRRMGDELRSRITRERQDRQRAIRNLRNEIAQALNAERAERERMIQEEADTRQREIAGLQQQIDGMRLVAERKAEWAADWLNNARIMRDALAANPRQRQFLGNRLERVERDLQVAAQNAANGVSEAALSQAQAAYWQLSDMRVELALLEEEWTIARAAALGQVREVLALAQAARNAKAVDAEGNEITDLEIEVDHWTGGKLSALEADMNKLLDEIQGENPPPGDDRLREIATRKSGELRRRLDQAIAQARSAVIASQARGQIAELAVEALEAQGYVLQDATYEGTDFRNGFAAKVGHQDGTEVVVLVEPVAGQPGQNVMRILSFDEGKPGGDGLRRQRSRDVAASMQRRGLQAGTPQEEAPRPDEQLRDMEFIRRGQRLQQQQLTVGGSL